MRYFAACCSIAFLSFSAIAEDALQESTVPEVITETSVVVNEPDAAPAVATDVPPPTLFQVKIEKHSEEELLELLTRAEKIAAGEDQYITSDPIVLVLSGEEIELFKRENYRDHKPLVDMAARLDAFNIIDVKVCTHWMSQRGIELTDLPPFVDDVPQAYQENTRLEKAGYAYF